MFCTVHPSSETCSVCLTNESECIAHSVLVIVCMCNMYDIVDLMHTVCAAYNFYNVMYVYIDFVLDFYCGQYIHTCVCTVNSR